MNTQEISLLAFLLERIRDEVLVTPWLLPITVPVGSPFLYIVIRNREEDPWCIGQIFYSPSVSVAQEVSARAIDDAHVPVFIFCTVLWVPYRVVHTIRRSQLHESFLLNLG